MDLIDKRLLSVVGDERFAHHMRATRTRLAALLLRAQELKSAGN